MGGPIEIVRIIFEGFNMCGDFICIIAITD